MTLQDFFAQNPKLALAFSGGTDSAYLLYAAAQSGADVTAYYVKTPFQPQFELDDAQRLVRQLGAKMHILPLDILQDAQITANPRNRCYFCKKKIFSAILQAAEADGYTVIADGTNASDDANDRPGMRALRELSVRSPLRECGLTKADVRARSREAGLFTWDKPAYACLATRIACEEPITAQKLQTTEQAETALFRMGFRDFRVRMAGDRAIIQIPSAQFVLLFAQREAILKELKPLYHAVLLDLEGRT